MYTARLIQSVFTSVSWQVISFFQNSETVETEIKEVKGADYKGDNTLAAFSIKKLLSSSREKLE